MRKIYVLVLSVLWIQFCAGQDINTAKKHLENRNASEAKAILEKLVSVNYNNAEAQYYLGRAYIMLKDGETASKHLEKAVELNPNNSDYHFSLGEAYGLDAQNSSIFTKARLAPKVKSEFQRAVDLNPKSVQARMGLINFYLLAPGIMGGSNKKALQEANTLIGIDEKTGRYTAAKIYIEEKNFWAAENEYKQLENKFGKQKENFYIFNDYGYFLIRLSRFDEAIQKFKKQVELAPQRANSYDSLGDGYKAAGKKNEAIASYKKALEIDPNFKASKDNLNALTK